MKNLIKLFSAAMVAGFVFASCEGPAGPQGQKGADGTNGTNGVDANETCKLCHNQSVVEDKVLEFGHSIHAVGTAYEEGTRTACAPCHSHQGYRYVVANNTPVTFVADPNNPGKFLNNYQVNAATTALPTTLSCFTCHDSLHTKYTFSDFFPLTTTAAVPMTMWGGTKTLNFAQNSSNLCAKCHQPRPVTNSAGNVIDYSLLVSAPSSNYTLSSVSYRSGIHYGAQAAMFGGKGGIEFGTGYTNSAHTASASCADCHMATPTGLSGGHSFSAYDEYGASVNFNGCNTTACHNGNMSKTNTNFVNYTSKTISTGIAYKLNQLAAKLNALGGGHDILQKDALTGEYNGYLDIYDASSNPTGWFKNPANGTPAFPTLTNAQFGAVINFQLVLRGGGIGVHNYPYMSKLLDDTMTAW